MSSIFKGKKCIVTGGMGFIGSHLVDKLLELGAEVVIIDHLDDIFKTNKFEYNAKINWWHEKDIPFHDIDLTESGSTNLESFLRDAFAVFHLAARFGGREYVDTKPADCCDGFAMNHNVISAACKAGVDRVHFASSACIYPPTTQNLGSIAIKEDRVLLMPISENEKYYMNKYQIEEQDKQIYIKPKTWQEFSDNAYGWVKLMGELELKSFHEQYGLKGSTCRFLTVYGEREYNNTHAIPMLIKKAFERQDPYIVWGDGKQERGFTHVSDIVNGIILATEKITDVTPINLGTESKYPISDIVESILFNVDLLLKQKAYKDSKDLTSSFRPKKIIYDESKPEGPRSRSLCTERAYRLLDGWMPEIDVVSGLQRTVSWYDENIYKKMSKSTSRKGDKNE